jgi:hypothetical protein
MKAESSMIGPLKRVGKFLRVDWALSALKSSARLAAFSASRRVTPVFQSRASERSDMALDLVIPVVDKDALTLPLVIDSARMFIRHPIKEVFLVCPAASVSVREIAAEKDCRIIEEGGLVPVGPKDIKYVHEGCNRSVWIYQQLLKWSGGEFCGQRRYLVMDSDTVFVRPQAFERDGKIVFDFCDSAHEPYFRAFERLVGLKARSRLSFTSHHSLIDIEVMRSLMAAIEAHQGMPWYRAIIASVDEGEFSCMSDYDTYGQYFLETRASEMCVRYWRNKSLPRSSLAGVEELSLAYGRAYATVSFHSYNK